jgi:DNA mismatch repair ATPase MutS
MEAGLGAIDTTVSAAGARALKRRLRGDASDAASAPDFRALIRALTGDHASRDALRAALVRTYESERILDGGRSVWNGALDSPKTLVAGGILVPPFFVAALALAPFYPTALAWLVGVALLGTIVRARLWNTIDTRRRSLRAAGELVAIAARIGALEAVAAVPGIARELRTDDARRVDRVNRFFQPFERKDEDPRRIVAEYTSLLLWWDVPLLIYGLIKVRQADAALGRLSHAVGDCDAACAFAAWRANSSDWCAWSTDGDALRMAAGLHPAIDSADPFDVALRAGVVSLVTGRHGAGKSTLLRALGFNTALAIATDTACAAEFTAPRTRIRTTFTHDDQPTGTASLFENELTRLADILADAGGRDRLLILLDEPLRGTNPEERRAITIATLEHLARHGHYVAATTNDPFIVKAISGETETFAVVRERRDDGSTVRTVRRGAQVERRAIALLADRGAPAWVIERATVLADEQLARDDL